MVDYTKIKSALSNAGHDISPDFDNKMSDPTFVERVRTALSNEGHEVSDSSTFYNKYSNTPKQVSTNNDIYSRALELGYSALSPEDKSYIDNAYSSSVTSKSKSLEQVHAEMDANARTSKQMATDNLAPEYKIPLGSGNDTLTLDLNTRPIGEALSNVYDLGRSGLAGITSLIGGGWNIMTGPKGNIGNPDQVPYTQAVGEAYDKAIAGKGLPGLASDPINLTMFIPGVGEVTAARLAGSTSKAGQYLATHPTIMKGIGGAVEGAGYTGASEAIDPTKEFNARDMVIGGGVSGSLGLGAGALKNWGKESFPGIMIGNARSIDAQTKTRLAAELDDILSQGFTPKNRRGFEQLSDRETAKLGNEFNKGIRESTPYSYYDESNRVRDIVDAEGGFMTPSGNMKSPTSTYHASGVRNDYMLDPKTRTLNEFGELEYMGPNGETLVPATGIPMLTPLSDIDKAVAEQYKRKLANADILSTKNTKILDKQLEQTKASKAYRDNIEEQVKAIYAPDLREEALDLYRNNPVYEAQELSNLRNARNDPNMYKDPSKSGEVQHANRLLATSWRDVINDRLGMDPRYAKHVTPEVRSRYGLYKAFGDVVDAPGSVRLSDRIFGLTMDPWMRASTIYKAGGLVDKLRKLTPTASSNIDNR